jgi:hypothetical protein
LTRVGQGRCETLGPNIILTCNPDLAGFLAWRRQQLLDAANLINDAVAAGLSATPPPVPADAGATPAAVRCAFGV